MGAAETRAALIARARREFAGVAAGAPRWGAIAPGRVNLIGDHTDYTGGLALPMAIDRWCVAVAGPARHAGRARIVSADWKSGESSVPLDWGSPLAEVVERLPRGHWARYGVGVMAEFESEGHRVPPLDVVIAGSVPLGSGLSSSAALEVAVATLLEEVTGVRLDPLAKARVCQRAEHRWAGVKCGLMDQMCAVMGREGCALLLDFAAASAEPVRLPEGLSVLVANSNVRHELAEGAYDRIVEECERAREAIGVGSLRQVRPEDAEVAGEEMEPGLYRRARHVSRENARTAEAAGALRAGDLGRLGAAMNASHRSLREYGVSCAELDALVDILTGGGDESVTSGVYGARMTGAGFGGCIVAAVAPRAVAGATDRLVHEYRRRCGRACDVFVVEATGGAEGLGLER